MAGHRLDERRRHHFVFDPNFPGFWPAAWLWVRLLLLPLPANVTEFETT